MSDSTQDKQGRPHDEGWAARENRGGFTGDQSYDVNPGSPAVKSDPSGQYEGGLVRPEGTGGPEQTDGQTVHTGEDWTRALENQKRPGS
jgi:hypothetical protein